jgi:hypothetical protein
MKAPFDFNLALILRLLLPGAVLAFAFMPLGERVFVALGVPFNWNTLFVILTVMGFVVFMLLEPLIFLLVTGRRFWPERLRSTALSWQTRRLEQIQARADAERDRARQLELDLMAANFPIAPEHGKPTILYPTRLGNVFASYETYPTVKYGLDGVFYWSRLLVVLNKDLRAEIDQAQAVADGALNAAFAFAGAVPISVLNSFLTSHTVSWLIFGAACIMLSYLSYLAALPKYVQFGSLFCAVFDQYRDRINFNSLVEELDAHMSDVRANARPQRELSRAAWRFLRWHRYRRSGAKDRNEIVVKW